MRIINFEDGFTSSSAPSVDQTAASVSVTPSGDLSSTNVQAALVELQGDIDAAEAAHTSHTSNVSNPHSVTKTQVSLGNVLNVEQVPASEKAQALGVATLDSGGRIPMGQLPDVIVGAVHYLGTWDANTNTPALANGTGSKGGYYVIATAGATSIDSITDWKIGDWIIFNGTIWQKIDNTEAVVSVNGYTGVIALVKADVGLGNVDNTSDATKNAAAVTLTNKTLTAPVISTISNTGTVILPTSGTLATLAGAEALTGKTQIVVDQLTLDDGTVSSSTDLTLSASGSSIFLTQNTRLTAGKSLIFQDTDNSQSITVSVPSDVTTNRTPQIPDASGDFVLTTATQTLTAKTLTSPTINTPTVSSPTVTGTLLLQNPSGAQPELHLSEDPDNGTNVVKIKAPATLAADYTLTLPVDDGSANQILSTDGSGVLSWASPFTNPMSTTGALPYSSDGSGTPASLVIGAEGKRLRVASGLPSWGWTSIKAASANYTILDTDGYDSVFVTTGASTRTITLPAAANNTGRKLTIKKIDNGAGKVTLAGAGSDTIDGSTGFSIGVGALNQYHYIDLVSDGTNWYVTAEQQNSQWLAVTPTGAWNTNVTYTGFMRREQDSLRVQVKIAVSGGNPNNASLTITVPSSWTIDTGKVVSQGSASSPVGTVTFLRSGTNTFVGTVTYGSSTTVVVNYIDDAANAVFYGQIAQSLPHAWTTNDTIAMEFLIPITEFAGR